MVHFGTVYVDRRLYTGENNQSGYRRIVFTPAVDAPDYDNELHGLGLVIISPPEQSSDRPNVELHNSQLADVTNMAFATYLNALSKGIKLENPKLRSLKEFANDFGASFNIPPTIGGLRRQFIAAFRQFVNTEDKKIWEKDETREERVAVFRAVENEKYHDLSEVTKEIELTDEIVVKGMELRY